MTAAPQVVLVLAPQRLAPERSATGDSRGARVRRARVLLAHRTWQMPP